MNAEMSATVTSGRTPPFACARSSRPCTASRSLSDTSRLAAPHSMPAEPIASASALEFTNSSLARRTKATNASPGSSAAAAVFAVSTRTSIRATSSASHSASLVGKFRYTVPTPTPARLAMSSMEASAPCAASISSAARSTFSRLRRASARNWGAVVVAASVARPALTPALPVVVAVVIRGPGMRIDKRNERSV